MHCNSNVDGSPPDPFGGGDASTPSCDKVKVCSSDPSSKLNVTTTRVVVTDDCISAPRVESDKKIDHDLMSEISLDNPGISDQEAASEANDENTSIAHNTDAQPLRESQAEKIVKYKFDDTYLSFVQNFTGFCEDTTNLLFDGSNFFDEDFFPRNMHLTEYVPINVVAPFVENFSLHVPIHSDHNKYKSCGTSIYTYFEDHPEKTETILRNQVAFVLGSLQCPKLTTLTIDSTPFEDGANPLSCDRLFSWHENVSSFIRRHAKTLKVIQMRITRHKDLASTSFTKRGKSWIISKGAFPKLHELDVTLWDSQVATLSSTDSDSESESESESESDDSAEEGEKEEERKKTERNCKTKAEKETNVWVPDWCPDVADQYWISLMKSQVHGMLTRLCWISAAKLSWNDVFQPIINSNRGLEHVHVIEVEGMMANEKVRRFYSEESAWNFCSASRVVISCAAFSKLTKLKSLGLRKLNCYLTDLKMLPQSLEELAVDDMSIKSKDISVLQSYSRLKVLRLANSSPYPAGFQLDRDKDHEGFGVDRDVLMRLLHTRSLEELCIWDHCLGIDFHTSSWDIQPAYIFNSILDKINTYLYV